MRKLSEVEEAKRLMTEAMDWSVFKWLWEKRTVRQMADNANAALDALQKKTKASWPDELRTAYKQYHAQAGSGGNKRRQQPTSDPPDAIDTELKAFLDKVKHADDNAYRARMDAERTFDEAERVLSTSMAREGCQKAIDSWNLYEKAIRLAETASAAKNRTEGKTKSEQR